MEAQRIKNLLSRESAEKELKGDYTLIYPLVPYEQEQVIRAKLAQYDKMYEEKPEMQKEIKKNISNQRRQTIQLDKDIKNINFNVENIDNALDEMLGKVTKNKQNNIDAEMLQDPELAKREQRLNWVFTQLEEEDAFSKNVKEKWRLQS